MTKTKTGAVPTSGSIIFIPLKKLKKSPRNARKMAHPKADIEALAASIAVNGILQMPVVEPEISKDGKPTSFYLVTIGEGRRQAQLLRVRRKQIANTEAVRCMVDTQGNALEISLAENAIRSDMHPADQFEAFFQLHRDHGMNAEDIAARFGVTPAVVKQRLKLAAISPVLMQVYRNNDINLDQLTAYAFTDDHARQEAVWDNLGADADRANILAALNDEHVAADDARALFVGLKAYQAAGGVVLRDLFDDEHQGFLTDAQLLHHLTAEKLEGIACDIKAEGWKWVEIMPRFDYSAVGEMRRIYPGTPQLSDETQAEIDVLQNLYEALETDGDSDEAQAEADRLEQAMAELQGDDVYNPDDIARAGVIVSIGYDGTPRIERGFVRREDDSRVPHKNQGATKASAKAKDALPDTLMAELTAHRTMALRNALGQQPEVAVKAVVHRLACGVFFPHDDRKSCLNIAGQSAYLTRYASGIEDSEAAQQIAARHAAWSQRMPEDSNALWTFILDLKQDECLTLLAVCASVTVDAVTLKHRGNDTSLDHADQLALAVQLDMRAQWKPTAQGYFARVSKDRILDAVREAVSPQAADNLASLKKAAMAESAEQRIEGKGWLPPVLRTPERRPFTAA